MNTLKYAVLAVALTVATPAASLAQAAPATLSPDADLLLRRSSAVLAAAKTLTLDLAVLREVDLGEGRVATLSSSTAIALRRPGELRAEMRGDATIADIIDDGKRVVVHSVAQGAYAAMPAPPRLDDLFPVLQDRLGLPVDIGDLLSSDPYAKLAADTSGEIVSATRIDDVPAWHLVLRSGDLNWELWVRQDATSLPVMASVTRGGLRTLYRFDDWRIDPVLGASLFQFTPASGVIEVPFAFRKETP